jgi:PAS domain S-box-containing protein
MFVFAGVALLSYRLPIRGLRPVSALVTALIAALVLAEFGLGHNLGIDTLLFPATVTHLGRVFPGRPAPFTAATLLCIGLVLLLARTGRPGTPPRWLTVLAVSGVLFPIVAIVGHLFDLPELYALTPRTGTALHSALALLAVALGTLVVSHEADVNHLLYSRDPGTTLLRRLLPLAVLLPLVFAVNSLWSLRLGLSEVHAVLVLCVASFIAICLGAAFWAAAMVRRADAERQAGARVQAELAVRDRLLKAEVTASAAVRENESRTRELLDVLSHAPVMARGLDGKIRFWSAGAERLYGWSAGEAVGAVSHELLQTRLPVPPREVEAALREQGEWHAELTRRARDGAQIRVASHWILHRDATGRADAVIEVDNDVTEQKRAERALRGSEARYRALVVATAQIVWTASPDGSMTSTDLSQWESFTGQPPGEGAWRGWLEAIHPDDRAEAIRAWNEAIQDRQPLATRHRLRRSDGEFRHMEVHGVPVVDDRGTVREWIVAHTDITDQVKAEEQLRQAQRLQAVGTLAGGVAHEVNNQLMAVLGFGDFALAALGPDHPQAADVQEMVRAATRAAAVAQQLLTFSRRQAKQTRVVELHAAVSALVPVLQRLLGADKTLVLAPTSARRSVQADPTQIDQVLINLTANARDAMGTGGKVSIAVEDVVLDEAFVRAYGAIDLLPGAYVRLTVSDTGSGMDQATLAQIFEPFYTTKPVGQGTGLGLSTVYGIVKQHDGFVTARSEPGAGTTMQVYLPAAPDELEGETGQQREERKAEPSMQGATVLVVEDEPSIRSLARRSLEAAGLTVVEAENGRHALEVVSAGVESPHLVLTDVIMPGLSGRELGEAVAAARPGLPVLFMSAYTGDDVLARGLLPEQAPFIQKPFAPEELVARVRKLLAGVE